MAHAPRRITILGSTGSIGEQTIDVLRRHPERFTVIGLSAGSNAEKLAQQVRSLRPQAVSIAKLENGTELQTACAEVGAELLVGDDAAAEVAVLNKPDLVVSAIVGEAGLLPTLRAVEAGINVGLATKETLVVAGELLTTAAKRTGAELLPIDSEHHGLWLCLRGRQPEEIRRLIITASGGPFWQRNAAELADITPEQAVNHPVWSMGRKISIDSATLMNKGLELIEAHWLFDTPFDRLDAVIHPQALVHAMVECHDGTMITQMAPADMRLPIAEVLAWPEPAALFENRLDLTEAPPLEFHAIDAERFPAPSLCIQAAERGGTATAVLNAANEAAIEQFCDGNLRFTEIVSTVEAILADHHVIEHPSLDDLLAASTEARERIFSKVSPAAR